MDKKKKGKKGEEKREIKPANKKSIENGILRKKGLRSVLDTEKRGCEKKELKTPNFTAPLFCRII
jgi:hypothetical protein